MRESVQKPEIVSLSFQLPPNDALLVLIGLDSLAYRTSSCRENVDEWFAKWLANFLAIVTPKTDKTFETPPPINPSPERQIP